jgi:argininosuccinate lyase
MPSSAGLWAAAHAEGLIDAAASIAGFWPRLDRSPLGSAAGYGVPLPLAREAAARALGFAGIDQVVTTTQNGRGMLEAQVLFWCATAAHDCAKLATDAILFSATEFGWLTLPAEFATGSSIMPQKRNPDLFELTRGRAAALEGDLAALMAIKGKLGSGYHRDFQLLKAPLWRGIDRMAEMLTMLRTVVPRLGVDATRAAAGLAAEVYATDEAIRRVRAGATFRSAYHEVAAEVKQGKAMPAVAPAALLAHRRSTGAMGNIPFVALTTAIRREQRWNAARRRHIDGAMRRLLTVRR